MVATRAVHFVATAVAVGSVIFGVLIAGPILQHHATVAISFRKRARRGTWACLVVAVISGLLWLLLQTSSMSGKPFNEALTADMLSTVLNETQFGRVTIIRAGLAICLAACLIYNRAVAAQWLGLAAATGLAGSLAWTGHAGSTVGVTGYLHLTADALHVVAAAAWIGGLVSLITFLTTIQVRENISLVRHAIGRFSTMGVVCVAIILLSGIVNGVILVGSFYGLVATEYGRLLMFKIAMFVVMLTFAAINRFRLTPQLAFTGKEQPSRALHYLIRNSAIETALGLGILVIVAVLGTLHPATHLVNLTTSR
ncbi:MULTISPECIES: copper homeostasis membrane protein CopD [unclassified Bradyrhizobium]|uniref:copper homeostasis membrane protein CopD n=1 Tax=unclassified Bradyrhizobium TaxID=2631580 RepID=UPI00247B0530|nr:MULTISPECIES: copper homeostasis membrane protein CopD [unclassified Bradyrhizobium]WGS22471.1 copper homeostasis membrane protein CopD [Bradyrhizobium sp. ISRA463]WGS29446.1 copper homeostasis membrane protein CopD [Bradyrhizobium sp. ISRA464]